MCTKFKGGTTYMSPEAKNDLVNELLIEYVRLHGLMHVNSTKTPEIFLPLKIREIKSAYDVILSEVEKNFLADVIKFSMYIFFKEHS